MRLLITLVVISFIYIGGVIEAIKTHAYSGVFFFSAVALAAAVMFFPFKEAAVVTALTLAMAISFSILRVGSAQVLALAAFILSVALSGYGLKFLTFYILDKKKRILEVMKEEYRSSSELDKKSKGDKLYLEKTVYDITSLYQAPKEMIASVTVEQLLLALRRSVEGYFDFKSSKIILSSFKDKEFKADKVYNIPSKEGEAQALSGYEQQLLDMMKGRKAPLIIDRHAGAELPQGLNIPDAVSTFVAVPLIAGDRTNGLFAAEDISHDDIVRFSILAHQFAMVLERIRLYELVQELAITDGVTGVFVRRHFLGRLGEEIKRAGHFHTHLSFLMIDLDHFKRCNDKFGHLVGDQVLKAAAGILSKNLREIDIIGRFGGEEFSIMLPETSKEDARVVGERLIKAVAGSEITAYDEKINVTISAGIATYPDDADEVSQLIDKADQMLYKAKESGRNRVCL